MIGYLFKAFIAKNKEFFKKAAVGYYVAAGVCLLMVLTAIVYAAGFSSINPELVAWEAVAFLWVGFGLALLCLILPIFVPMLKEYMLPAAPWVLLGCALIALAFFAPKTVIEYVTTTGSADRFTELRFLMPTILFVLTPIAATPGIFFKSSKKEQINHVEEN